MEGELNLGRTRWGVTTTLGLCRVHLIDGRVVTSRTERRPTPGQRCRKGGLAQGYKGRGYTDREGNLIREDLPSP